MSNPKRIKPKVYKARYYRQAPLNQFKEVLYLFRKDRTNYIYVLAFNPGNDFVNKVSRAYNYSTDLRYATQVKAGYYKEFRLRFISPDSTPTNFNCSDKMDRLVKYVPKRKERKLDKDFMATHTVKYAKDVMRELVKKNCDSYGELKVYNWLKKHKVKFLNQEKGHLGCYSPSTGVRMPYDFEIPKIKTVIEVQGIQHFKVTKKMNNTQLKLERQKQRDTYKREFAKINGYKEIELSYKDMKNGSWETKLQEILNDYQK